MISKPVRLTIAFLVILNIGRLAHGSFEAKIILMDKPNKLIALDRGSNYGINEKDYFYLYREGREVAEVIIFKTSAQVAIGEITRLSENEVIRLNETFIFLTEQEKTDIKPVKSAAPYTDIPASETELKSTAQKIAEEEVIRRKLGEMLAKERAKGIAEAIKTEKELQQLKEAAEVIVKEVIEEKKKEKHIISVNFKETNIQNSLKIIAREANVNIVIPPDFPYETISLSLNDVEVEFALAIILGMVNYTFEKKNNVYKLIKSEVAQKTIGTETYTPHYIQVEKLKTLITDAGLLSGDGKLVVDSRSNKIMVIDVPKNLQKIDELIKYVDVKPKQVTIQAKIIDVSLTDTEKLGIEWTWVKPRAGAATDDTVRSGFRVDPVTALGRGLFSYGTLNAAEIAAVLSALMERERADILSKPTITTISNEEAKINVTTKVAYIEGTTTTTTEGVAATSISWAEKEVGIILSVTPYITQLGSIIMKIEPTASLLQGWTSEDPRTRYPLIMTRSAVTQVMVNDGETLVIGGLITQEMRDIKSGIPLISDIPIIGIPFRKKSKELKNTELIIFITPHIVPSEEKK